MALMLLIMNVKIIFHVITMKNCDFFFYNYSNLLYVMLFRSHNASTCR